LKTPKLSIELVPETCWYSNVRSEVSKDEWDILRRKVYKIASYQCEICTGVGPKWPVECHEVWHYDDVKKIQTLKRMIALCPNCHEVKHIGLASIKGRYFEAVKWLARINTWPHPEAENYVEDCMLQYRERSVYNWQLNLYGLNQYKENCGKEKALAALKNAPGYDLPY